MFRVIPHRALIEPKAALISVERGRAVLRVEGLLCSACAANVRRRLERVPGVGGARINLESGEAIVSYDPARTDPQALIAAVESAVLFPRARRLLAALRGRRAS